jgi:hypothetical protein
MQMALTQIWHKARNEKSSRMRKLLKFWRARQDESGHWIEVLPVT